MFQRANLFRALQVASLSILVAASSLGQVHSFALNAQHTSQYGVTPQRMNRIKWSLSINENLSGSFAHYGAPLITAAGTIIIMVRTATNGYDLLAVDSATGTQKYRLATGYTQPPGVVWLTNVQPVITTGTFGTRVYYPGAGGTLWRLDDPDALTPGTPTRIVYYGTESTYLGNQAAFDSSVNLNTPITADSDGNLFFGTRVTGTAPAPLSTTQSHIVRIDGTTETATYVECGTAAADAAVSRVTHGGAPALSNDEGELYVAVKGTSSVTQPYLLRLDATSLATLGKVLLKDPRNGNNASVNDLSTASPMIAPDGDVFYGVLSNPSNGSRGFLLRFSEDLTVTKTPGGFGWDYTAGLVPASMVPSYTGTSSYLLFCKYNNYVSGDGNGIHQVAILDPNDTQIDYHATAGSLVQMRQVLFQIGPSPDPAYPTYVGANREWCINASAVVPSNNSVYFNCEDGHQYRWDLSTNSLSESIQLNAGLGQPYVPSIVGPDGTLYTLNGGYLFAVGDYDDVSISITSDQPDTRTLLEGEQVTFTATVSGNLGTATGTVTFEDVTIESYAPVTTVLATVPLVNGVATYTTSALSGGAVALGSHLGNHRIKAVYSGDTNYPAGEAKLHQKVHAFSSDTALGATGSFEFGDPITFTSTTTRTGGGSEIPTGYVTFWNGNDTLAQNPLNGSGVASTTTSALTAGVHAIDAEYTGDTWFTSSVGTMNVTVWEQTNTTASASASYVALGDTATLQATIAAQDPAAGTPAGSVTFFEGVTNLGTATVNSSGEAGLPISTLSTGVHTITASFDGNDGWYDSVSTSFTVTVMALNSLSLSPTNPKASAGSTGTVTISSAAPVGGWDVTLGSNDVNAVVGGTVTVPEGATTVNFPVTTTNTGVTKINAIIEASTGTSIQTANLSIFPDDNSAFVSQTAPTSMIAGQTYTYQVTFQNTGTTPWTRATYYQLSAWLPSSTTWISAPVQLAVGETILPGQSKTFNVTSIAPTTAGSYPMQFRMTHSGIAIFGAISTLRTVNVTVAPMAAQLVSHTPVPTTMLTGQLAFVSFTYKNVGTTTWSEADLFRLYSRNPPLNLNWGFNRLRIGTGVTVAPGQTVTFTATAQAPWTAGTYNFQFRMGKEGVAYFGDETPNRVVTVNPAPLSAVFMSQSVPSTVARGTTFLGTITMKNTGTSTWTRDDLFRLYSQNPTNNTIWGLSRIFLPTGVSVAPGASYTFSATFTAPATPGPYNFRWRMGKDGVAYFGELTPNLVITVT